MKNNSLTFAWSKIDADEIEMSKVLKALPKAFPKLLFKQLMLEKFGNPENAAFEADMRKFMGLLPIAPKKQDDTLKQPLKKPVSHPQKKEKEQQEKEQKEKENDYNYVVAVESSSGESIYCIDNILVFVGCEIPVILKMQINKEMFAHKIRLKSQAKNVNTAKKVFLSVDKQEYEACPKETKEKIKFFVISRLKNSLE